MNTLLVIAGPTAVGKTRVAVELAKHFSTEIISADSRQFYKEIPIGTAAPTIEEQQDIPHHFVGNLRVSSYYNAYNFEQDALSLLDNIYKTHKLAIVCGGSGMYIDALCNGIDLIPDIDNTIRQQVINQYKQEGLEGLRNTLKILDPAYYALVDLKNHMRLMRAIEVCIQTGSTYSSVRTMTKKHRDFQCIKIALNVPREELYQRIHTRVDKMLEDGLEQEARSVYSLRDCTALKTVGYRELFSYFAGECSKDIAIEKIKQNTRNYAKRQITWFHRDSSYTWFSPYSIPNIISHINSRTTTIE